MVGQILVVLMVKRLGTDQLSSSNLPSSAGGCLIRRYFHLLTTFKATPNPFSTNTTIEYALVNSVKNASFQLTDITSKLIKQIPLLSIKGTLSIGKAGLQKGVYYGQLLTDQGRSEVIKLVVQ